MEMPDGTSDIVHPEVRAHINSLVSAVSIGEQGRASNQAPRFFSFDF